MIHVFKQSIVIVSALMSLTIIFDYFILNISEQGSAGKSYIGSQRFGFVYLLSFWIVFMNITKSKYQKTIKFIIILLILSGIILTFSRATIVGLIASFVIYLFLKKNISVIDKIKSKSNLLFFKKLLSFFIVIFVIYLMYIFYPGAFSFYEYGMLKFDFASINEKDSSLGYRIFILKEILEFVTNNPLTGSGFLGIWIMFADLSGSAHNQYTDVLFRTGFIGFTIYVLLLIKIFRFLLKKEPDLFFGFVGILVFGFFHETFKESQGGFILSFMLGMLIQHRRASSSQK